MSANLEPIPRTSRGKTVCGVVVPETPDGRGMRSTGALERELDELERAFGTPPIKLVYGLTSKPERPLEVERVPEGELL